MGKPYKKTGLVAKRGFVLGGKYCKPRNASNIMKINLAEFPIEIRY
jgi:hypothetical protein